MASSNNSSRCYYYNDFNNGEGWGNCCEELSIVPKPLWVVFLISLPIEAVLAGADVRASKAMYAKKEDRTALVFVVYNLTTLALLAANFDWSCDNSAEGIFECYQGLIFMFYNSTAALATLTLWMLVVMRKFYVYMYKGARTILWPSLLWRSYENIHGGADEMDVVIAKWQDIANSTGLYWYNKLLIFVTLLFGGITHVLPMTLTYPFIVLSLALAMVLSHSTRLAYISSTTAARYKNLRSVAWNIFVFWPSSVVLSTILVCLFPVKLVFAFFQFAFRCFKQCVSTEIESSEIVPKESVPEETTQHDMESQTKPSRHGQIFLKTLTGKTITTVVDFAGSVEELMQDVERREGIPVDQQRIIFNGQQLNPGDSLADHNVQKESTLHLVLRLGQSDKTKTEEEESDGIEIETDEVDEGIKDDIDTAKDDINDSILVEQEPPPPRFSSLAQGNLKKISLPARESAIARTSKRRKRESLKSRGEDTEEDMSSDDEEVSNELLSQDELELEKADDWEELYDENGQPYYHNERTSETIWEKPLPVSSEEGLQQAEEKSQSQKLNLEQGREELIQAEAEEAAKYGKSLEESERAEREQAMEERMQVEKEMLEAELEKRKTEEEKIKAKSERKKKKKKKKKVGKAILKYVKDVLKNLCMYDPNGKLIMFAASTTFLCFTLSANYGLLFYTGAPYERVIVLDFESRQSSLWFQCTKDNFVNFNAFGLIDFIGVAVAGVGAIMSFGDFIVSL